MTSVKRFGRVALFVIGVALLLISHPVTGTAWAITGGEPDENRHPNVGAIVVYNPELGARARSSTRGSYSWPGTSSS